MPRAAGLCALLWISIGASLLFAPAEGRAVQPPPGGHHPLYFGGDNRAGYPALTVTDIGQPAVDALPGRLSISIQPNPFQGSTTLRMTLRRGQTARLGLYDLAGKRVRDFVVHASGNGWEEIAWDGRDQRGQRLPAGAYFYRLHVHGQVETGKLVLLR